MNVEINKELPNIDLLQHMQEEIDDVADDMGIGIYWEDRPPGCCASLHGKYFGVYQFRVQITGGYGASHGKAAKGGDP